MITENESIRLVFGLKLKTLRQERGLNYQQLSQDTGIAVSYLHDMESGKKYPKADKIIALARVLKVEYDYLVSLNAGKRLQPIVDLINSDFMHMLPWQHFGLQPHSVLDLFSNTPDKITAFISTLIKLSRSVQMSKENFYTSALRSYQDLHDNYFPELEKAAADFRQAVKLKDASSLGAELLEQLLQKQFGIVTDRKTIASKEALRQIRSCFAPVKKTFYLNKGYTAAQEKFLLAREIGFQYLQLEPRPYETILQNPDSFEVLLNNFKASYFASALLMPEDLFTEAIRQIAAHSKWQDKAWLDLMQHYDVTAEMLLQRLSNILPSHFGIDQLFFLRMNGDMETDYFDMTKELHLSQLHSPYANALNEHYCRRWVSIHSMKEVYQKQQTKKYRQPVVHAQVSQYWQTHNRYFCITIARPFGKTGSVVSSVTIGLLIDAKLAQQLKFVNDQAVPTKTVHTTCERCGIADCKERAAAPVIITREQQKAEAIKAIAALNEV